MIRAYSQLSASTLAVLRFVVQFIEQRHYAPTVREIVDGTLAQSTSTAAYHLHKLELYGLIGRDHGARALWVTAEGQAAVEQASEVEAA